MKYSLILLIFFLSLFISSYSDDFQKIPLTMKDYYYYIPLKLSPNASLTYYIFSNYLPINFFPSFKCEICQQYHINESNPEYFTFVKENASVPYYYFYYFGDVYRSTITTVGDKTYQMEQDFIAFRNITYVKNYTGYGRFSLSYLNYNFTTEKKIFAIKFDTVDAELHLGGYDTTIINNDTQKKLKTFKVIVDENNSTDDLYQSMWYMEFPKLYINNELVKKETNLSLADLENNNDLSSSFYTPLLSSGPSSFSSPMNNNKYKLTLDMSTDKLYIPKDFFFENVKSIFPPESKCQILDSGYFYCQCSEDYKEQFGNFKFEADDGEIFFINTTDYIVYESSISGSYCYVHIIINYENDAFIGGIAVLNNYYNIFNIDENTFHTYQVTDNDQLDTAKYIILFFVVAAVGELVLFGGYFCYKKYAINNPENIMAQANQNNNNNAGNNNNGNNDEINEEQRREQLRIQQAREQYFNRDNFQNNPEGEEQGQE